MSKGPLTKLDQWENERAFPFLIRKIQRYLYLRLPFLFPSSITKSLGVLKILICAIGLFVAPHWVLYVFSISTVVGSFITYLIARNLSNEKFSDSGTLFYLEEGALAATKGAVVIFIILVSIDLLWWKTGWFEALRALLKH